MCLISTIGLASWNKLEPANRYLQIGIGGSVIFKASIIVRPFPRPGEWHWTFSPSKISHSVLTHPPDVHIVINDGQAILNITNVTGFITAHINCGPIVRMEAGRKMI